MPSGNTQGVPAYSWGGSWEGAKTWVTQRPHQAWRGTFQAHEKKWVCKLTKQNRELTESYLGNNFILQSSKKRGRRKEVGKIMESLKCQNKIFQSAFF